MTAVPKSPPINSKAHRAFVCTFECAARSETCYGRIDPHHVTTRGAGGGDETCIPLCRGHHIEIHAIGVETFAKKHGLDLLEKAALLWKKSPANKL